MNYRKYKKISIAILVTFILTLSINFWQDKIDLRIIEAYNDFYTSDIKGKLKSTGIKYHMTSFKLQETDQEYILSPYTDTDGELFDAISKPGDSILKPAFSDTIIVKKEFEKYKFTFKNFQKTDK